MKVSFSKKSKNLPNRHDLCLYLKKNLKQKFNLTVHFLHNVFEQVTVCKAEFILSQLKVWLNHIHPTCPLIKNAFTIAYLEKCASIFLILLLFKFKNLVYSHIPMFVTSKVFQSDKSDSEIFTYSSINLLKTLLSPVFWYSVAIKVFS